MNDELWAIDRDRLNAEGDYEHELKYELRGLRWALARYKDNPPATGESVAAYRERLFALLEAPSEDRLSGGDFEAFKAGVRHCLRIARQIPEDIA